ncbi:hypothetical protein JOQ06_009796 [Pogonophryne albipinna]|uniref:exodeoxyribonuclease III n=1 Tax=Pogonophryne albipinna TaxID=1090488 RepID=A0AAD6BQ86_9TELE|nr:hypothetical protein JOQ06_009796 [Pogonophryne albipinna]
MSDIKLGSLNINGARGDAKRASLFTLLGNKSLNVTFLQETHSTAENESDWRREWGGEGFFSHKRSNSGGVAILFARGFTPFSCTVDEVIPGHLLKINAEFEKVKICFINIYAPSVGAERLLFFEKLKHTLSTCDNGEYLFLGGDFNCTENPVLDRNHQEPHAASKSALIRLTETFELCDVWRHFHPGQRQYTWVHSRDNLLSLARLDRVYVFNHHINCVLAL